MAPCRNSSVVEQCFCKAMVAGSIPASGSKFPSRGSSGQVDTRTSSPALHRDNHEPWSRPSGGITGDLDLAHRSHRPVVDRVLGKDDVGCSIHPESTIVVVALFRIGIGCAFRPRSFGSSSLPDDTNCPCGGTGRRRLLKTGLHCGFESCQGHHAPIAQRKSTSFTPRLSRVRSLLGAPSIRVFSSVEEHRVDIAVARRSIRRRRTMLP